MNILILEALAATPYVQAQIKAGKGIEELVEDPDALEALRGAVMAANESVRSVCSEMLYGSRRNEIRGQVITDAHSRMSD